MIMALYLLFPPARLHRRCLFPTYISQFYIVVSGVIRVSRRSVLTEGSPGGDHEVNRLYAGSTFDAGALLAGENGT